MPTIDNVRVFPEGAGIRERGFGTQVTGRLDDGNSITFAELLKEWYCHITGNPKAVLPYLKNRKNPKKLDISNDDERRIFSDKWYISYASGFNKTVIPVEQLTHDAIHTMLGMPTSWIGEHHVHYAQPLIGLQIGCGIGGFPFGRKAIDWQIHKSESGFFKDIQIDKILKAWNSKSSENLKGSLSAYFSALMIGSVNINREQSICDSVRENYLLFCKSFDSKYLKKTVSSQWRYAGFLTSLHKINKVAGNFVDITKPWNSVSYRIPLDTLRDQMRGSFPVRPEEQQAIQEYRKEFGAEAEQFPLIDPRLLRFPPTLRERILAFEENYGDKPAPRGDYLKPDMSLFPSITPYSDQRDGANAMIQTMLCTYDRWVRIQRGEEEPTSLEKLAARVRQAAARPPQERPPVDIDIGATLLEQFTKLVTK